MAEQVFVHDKAMCESDQVGAGTRIWAFAHVMKRAVIGRDCNIGEGAFVESGVVLGDRVTVKNNVAVWDGVTVEDDAFLGPACVMTNRRRPRSSQGNTGPKAPWDPIVIRQGASIGAGAVLVCPVTVGRYALVGAGAVVTKDVPDHGLVVGSPARLIGHVCKCGQTLNENLVCPDCGLTYRRGEDGWLTAR